MQPHTTTSAPFVLLRDDRSGQTMTFTQPLDIVTAHSADDIILPLPGWKTPGSKAIGWPVTSL